jgi:hypothetical protein
MSSDLTSPAGAVVEGQPIGVGCHALCTTCGEVIEEGQDVQAYLYRPEDASQWDIGMVSCNGWDREPCRTLGVVEIWARARVGVLSDQTTQQARYVLHAPDVLAVSESTDGVDPE